MISRILAIGVGVAAEVRAAVSAEVYGVFKHTLVLRSSGNLIAITTKPERHYYTVNVTGPLPAWKAGQEIPLSREHIGNVSLQGIKPWNCRDVGAPVACLSTMDSIVNQIKTGFVNPGLMLLFMDEGGPEPPGPPMLAKARQGLDLLSQGISAGSSETCIQGALHLAGLGPGLTPAGDDMISGFLAGLYWLTGEKGHSPAVQQCVSAITSVVHQRSNDYGAQVVRCASFGELTESAFDVLISMGRGISRQDIERLAMVGSTSGMDMLAGICAAVAVLPSMQL